MKKILDLKVYPSKELTISVEEDKDYGGAHEYSMRNSVGFNGMPYYVESEQTIRFVQKNLDGSMTPGIQSEQLVLILLDRTKKLDAAFPSDQNKKMIEGLEMFLEACKERIDDRISRGVMGELKK